MNIQIHCKYDDIIPREKLKPHPKNRNKHPENQIVRLSQILKYQGIRAPIVVSSLSGYIVKGHGTSEALWLAGESSAPVVYQDFESDEQEYAFLQSDNAIASWAELDLSKINVDLGDLGPDFDINLLGIKDFVIEPADKFQEDEDAVPEPPKEAKTKLGELYQLGDHRLLCGDSTSKEQVERLMNGEKADMVFTDPPYNVASHSKNYVANFSSGMDTLSKSEWDMNCDIEKLLSNLLLTTKKAFTAYIWTSQFLIHRIWNIFEGHEFVGYLVWNKLNPLPSMSKRHPAWNTELCVYKLMVVQIEFTITRMVRTFCPVEVIRECLMEVIPQ